MSIDLEENARIYGMVWQGSKRVLKPFTATPTRNLPKRTLEAVAACSVHGLSYWAHAPERNTVWAVDDDGNAHTVWMDPKRQASRYNGKTMPYGIAPTFSDLLTQIGGTIDNEYQEEQMTTTSMAKPPAKKAPAKKAPIKKAPAKPVKGRAPAKPVRLTPAAKTPPSFVPQPRTLSMSLRNALTLICHDPDYLEDIDNESLVKSLGRTPYDDRITAELKARGLTPVKRPRSRKAV